MSNEEMNSVNWNSAIEFNFQYQFFVPYILSIYIRSGWLDDVVIGRGR